MDFLATTPRTSQRPGTGEGGGAAGTAKEASVVDRRVEEEPHRVRFVWWPEFVS